MSGRAGRARREEGVVLLVVVFFYVLLISFVATFLRRATLDAAIVRNRDQAAQAEALARGGIELATALLLEDSLRDRAAGLPLEHGSEPWSQVGEIPIEMEDGGSLRLQIADAGARLNLNALFPEGDPDERTEPFLMELLAKVIEEMPGRPEEKTYDPAELARHLIDFVDPDGVSLRGEPEDEYYQLQDPPYAAANRPLLSLEELRLVQGFDGPLVEALRPYVTVYPFAKGGGVNVNTAPSWVLATLFVGVGAEYRLADEDLVARVLRARQDGDLFCPPEMDLPDCTRTVQELADQQTIFPEPRFTADVFEVRSEATVGTTQRSVFAVIDRSELAEPRLLAWRSQ